MSISRVILFHKLSIKFAELKIPASAMHFYPHVSVTSAWELDILLLAVEGAAFFIFIKWTNSIKSHIHSSLLKPVELYISAICNALFPATLNSVFNSDFNGDFCHFLFKYNKVFHIFASAKGVAELYFVIRFKNLSAPLTQYGHLLFLAFFECCISTLVLTVFACILLGFKLFFTNRTNFDVYHFTS